MYYVSWSQFITITTFHQSIAVLSSYDNILNGSSSLGKEKASFAFESSNSNKAKQAQDKDQPVLIDFESDSDYISSSSSNSSSSSSSSHDQSHKSSIYSIAKPPQSSIPNIIIPPYPALPCSALLCPTLPLIAFFYFLYYHKILYVCLFHIYFLKVIIFFTLILLPPPSSQVVTIILNLTPPLLPKVTYTITIKLYSAYSIFPQSKIYIVNTIINIISFMYIFFSYFICYNYIYFLNMKTPLTSYCLSPPDLKTIQLAHLPHLLYQPSH